MLTVGRPPDAGNDTSESTVAGSEHVCRQSGERARWKLLACAWRTRLCEKPFEGVEQSCKCVRVSERCQWYPWPFLDYGLWQVDARNLVELPEQFEPLPLWSKGGWFLIPWK